MADKKDSVVEAKKKLEGMKVADAFTYLKTLENETLISLSDKLTE